jgi:hypothetical protein
MHKEKIGRLLDTTFQKFARGKSSGHLIFPFKKLEGDNWATTQCYPSEKLKRGELTTNPMLDSSIHKFGIRN